MAELSAGVKVDEAALEVAKQAASNDYDVFHNLREAVTCAINAYLSETGLTEEVERLRGNDATLQEAYEQGTTQGLDEALERDKLAEVIESYMGRVGEFRSYDLADRIRRQLVPNWIADVLAGSEEASNG